MKNNNEKIIPVTVGTELSYIGSKNQAIVNDILDYECCRLSLQQAVKIKQLYIDGNISREAIEKVITGDNGGYEEKISLNYTRLKKYFPKDYSVKQCEAALWRILDDGIALTERDSIYKMLFLPGINAVYYNISIVFLL